ncbi:MAG: hypothetical protein WCS70_06490 [Verrucomicrobiota bacterium]
MNLNKSIRRWSTGSLFLGLIALGTSAHAQYTATKMLLRDATRGKTATQTQFVFLPGDTYSANQRHR